MFGEQMLSNSLVAAVADLSKVGAMGSVAVENPVAFSVFPSGSGGVVIQVSVRSHDGRKGVAIFETRLIEEDRRVLALRSSESLLNSFPRDS